MAQIQPRDYLTFAELMTRWQISENDLRHAIICGAVKPCVLLTGWRARLKWIGEDEHGFMHQTEIRDYRDDAVMYTAEGWHYLQAPRQTGPFECIFYYASNDRDAEMNEESSSNWYALNQKSNLKDVEKSAVFLITEIQKYEADNSLLSGAVASPETDKPLGTTERNTLLKLVIGMAIKGYRYDPTALKSNVPTEIVDDLAELGIAIDNGTVLKYLKAAANTVLPAKPRQP